MWSRFLAWERSGDLVVFGGAPPPRPTSARPPPSRRRADRPRRCLRRGPRGRRRRGRRAAARGGGQRCGSRHRDVLAGERVSTRPGPAGTGARVAAGPEAVPGRQRDAERTRAEILAVATEEFSERGLAGARVDEIAAKT